jgi:DnaK suppressor protein
MAKNYKTLILDPKYVPKKTEKYMSEEQKAFFYNLLNAQRTELLALLDNDMTKITLSVNIDDMDGPNDEADNSIVAQTADAQMKMIERNKNLMNKIDAALERIENNSYGYSIVSSEEIGIKRMIARPLATMTTEEQEEYEKKEI